MTWLSTHQAAREMGVTQRTIVRWIRRGELRAVNIGSVVSPRYRIAREHLAEFIGKRLARQGM